MKDKIFKTILWSALYLVIVILAYAGYFHRWIYLAMAVIAGFIFLLNIIHGIVSSHMDNIRKEKDKIRKEKRREEKGAL